MLTKVSFTFGSHQILEDIIKNNPDRQFKLVQASTHSNKLALFDLSGQDPVFKSPVTLNVLESSLNASLNGVLYYQSFQVNGVLMTSVANHNESSTLVLLTSWNDFEDLTAWRESDSFKSLTNFTTMGSDNYYYDEIYRPVR